MNAKERAEKIWVEFIDVESHEHNFIVNAIAQQIEEAWKEGFSEAIEAAAKLTEETNGEHDYGVETWFRMIAEKIRSLKPSEKGKV